MTYATFSFATSVIRKVIAHYNPQSPQPTEEQVREQNLTKVLINIFSQQRLTTPQAYSPLEHMIVLRQTKSWHTVVSQLDQVKENAANKEWKWAVKKIAGLAIALDYQLKNSVGSAQQFLDDTRFEKELPKILSNFPPDCSNIASYIKTNLEALLAFRSCDEASADQDCTFFEIVDPTNIQLTQTIGGVFVIRESLYNTTKNPDYPNHLFIQSRQIECISNISFPIITDAVYTANFNIIQRAIKSANTQLNPG